MSHSNLLFDLADLPPAVKYDKLFENLPMLKENIPKTGILYCQNTCPILHPKFFKGKGCNVLVRMEPSIRSEIGYDTQEFKELYKKRTSVERIFSRLLAIAMQHPTVRGYNANRNHATIAHISVLLVALTAYLTGYQDKMRFVNPYNDRKSFFITKNYFVK